MIPELDLPHYLSTAPVAAPPHRGDHTSTLPEITSYEAVGDQFSLVLATDGDGWVGTFGVLLAALLEDLLPEGALQASVAYLDEEGDGEEYSRTGWIVGYDKADARIDWSDGTVLCTDWIIAIGI